MKIIQHIDIRQEESSQLQKNLSLDEQIHYVTHKIHNKKHKNGRINRFNHETGIYSANSISPFADGFIEYNIEDDLKDIVASLKDKGFFTYSSCASHSTNDRRFVGLAFPNEILKIRFLKQMKFLEEYGVKFKELDTVINQESSLKNNNLESTPLGESGQRFVSVSSETAVFNIQFHCDANKYFFVEMILFPEYNLTDLLTSPLQTIRVIARRLFKKDESTRIATDFIKTQLIP